MDIIEETLVQQCVFCIKTSEECELIDMSVSSIVLGSEILDFEDIIRNILELKVGKSLFTMFEICIYHCFFSACARSGNINM